MNDEKLYGYLVVTNVCKKQIYEYKRLFAKSINLNQVDKKDGNYLLENTINNCIDFHFILTTLLKAFGMFFLQSILN